MATSSIPSTSTEVDTDTPAQPKNPRIPDDAVPYFKILRKLVMTHTKATHHSTFLHDCINRRATPKGLQAKISAQIPEPDLDFTLKWEQAHWDFSRELTTLLANYYSNRAKTTEGLIAKASTELATRCDQTTLTYIHKLNSTLEQTLKTDLQERRNRKTVDSRNTKKTVTITKSTTEVTDKSPQPTSDS